MSSYEICEVSNIAINRFKTFQIFRKTWILHGNGWSLELKAILFSKYCFCCQASFHILKGYYLTDNTILINLFSHIWSMSSSFYVALQCFWAAEPSIAQSASSCFKDIYLWLLAIPLFNVHTLKHLWILSVIKFIQYHWHK